MSEPITFRLNEVRYAMKELARALESLTHADAYASLDSEAQKAVQAMLPQLANLRVQLARTPRGENAPALDTYVEGVRIPLPLPALRAFCEKWHIVEFALFGSVLREDFRPESDVDVLVRYAAQTPRTFSDFMIMQAELEQLLGHAVEITERDSLNKSTNEFLRKSILHSAKVIYAA